MANETYTLVTGSSMGIGKALANECAARGMNLLLVALPNQNLGVTTAELAKNYNIKTDFLEIDLTQPDSPQKIYNWCKKNNRTVNILINNAGAGGTTRFDESTPEYSDLRIQLNIRALVLLCRLFIPEMKNLTKAHILNVGSMSAFYPIAFKSVYCASKAFVLRFTLAVNEELRGSSVKMSVVNPNGVQSNEGTGSRIKAHGLKGKLTMVPIDKLAQITIKRMMKGKVVILPGKIDRFLVFLGNIVPTGLKVKMLAKEFRKEIESDTILN
ncbi:MAG: SDR family NAD(P)-dependent oxidoreductase [Bacteroidales bacterium]|nr:SDR family NAD(P)-dependent oxidoreductase [Bacteroidales bacterium]